MPRSSRQDAVEHRLSERDDPSIRYVDLEFAICREGEAVLVAGGLWDRRSKGYAGDATRGKAINVHPGQAEPLEWFRSWLDAWEAHQDGAAWSAEERKYTLVLAGGQRSGKTWLGVAMAIFWAIMAPRSRVWVVCPTKPQFEEVQKLIGDTLPADWYRSLGSPWWRYELVNGSWIVLKSAHKPDALKNGDCDFVVMNEAQQQSERAFHVLRQRIAKSGTLVVMCANPPEKPIGQWVGDVVSDAEHGRIQAQYYNIDPMSNPHIDHGPLLAFQKEVDERTFDIVVRGKFRGAENAVFYNWDRLVNEVPTPEVGDITEDVMQRLEGRALQDVVGVDVQKQPMAAVRLRFFRNPLVPDDEPKWWRYHFLWAVQEIVLDRADEDDLALAMLDTGLDPTRTLIVIDASAEWQFAERGKDRVRELKKRGRGSRDILRQHGFQWIVKPDPESESNPDVIERFRCAIARVRTAAETEYGRHFLFSDPANRRLNAAFRNLPYAKGGVPSRDSKHAHLADAATYPVFRFFPRRADPAPPKVEVVRWLEGRKRTGPY